MRFLRARSSLCFLMLFLLIFFFAHICPAAENVKGPYSKGLSNFKQGNFEEALTQFEEAVKTSPDNAKAHYYLGLTLSRLGRNADAALALEKAGELDPKLPGLHLNLGIAYYKLETFEPALLELNRALQKDPKDGSAHLFTGLTPGTRAIREVHSIPRESKESGPRFQPVVLVLYRNCALQGGPE